MDVTKTTLFAYNSIEQYCLHTESLIALEREEELQQASILNENASPKLLEKKGVCLTKLSIDGKKTSLYGRQIITLKSSNVNRPELPANEISTGDIVGLHLLGPDAEAVISSGIVVRISSISVSVAFDQSDSLANLGDDGLYYIIKLANDVTYRRLKSALNKLKSGKMRYADPLIDLLFQQTPESSTEFKTGYAVDASIQYHNASLDSSQRKAVRLALSQPHLAIIHGPPGTGKSTTVCEVIQQFVGQGLKVLACAPSNVAVDNLVLRLAKAKVCVTRLGHPARLMSEIHSYSLDAKISASDEHSIVGDIRKDIDSTLKNMRHKKGTPSHSSLANELKSLRKELKTRSNEAVRQVLKRSDVILSTLTSATEEGPLKILEDMHFDVVVIDECSQALEAACWIGLLHSPKCVLAGDHLQLPPTILSHKAAAEGLAVTLMERLIPTHRSHVHMLTVQYRMNKDIMQWASDELYNGQLTADGTVADHLLKDLPGVEENEITSESLILIDTDGCSLNELDLPDEQSCGNEGEADLVAIHVQSLVQSGVKPHEIAVISPYNLQVELIRNRLSDKYRELEIKSVDGYQGREKEAVVISLVRSNNKGVVGFLSEDRRLNVAVTRARRQVTIICDSNTVCKHPFLGRLITYMREHGLVTSAAEYEDGSIGQVSDRVAQIFSQSGKVKTGKSQSKKKKSTSEKSASASNKPSVEATVSIRETKEEREKRIREEITTIIGKFYNGEGTVHKFPPTLNSYERMIVHQVAESYGLEHGSVGEAADRHIVVKKQTKTKSELKSAKHPVVMDTESRQMAAQVDGKPTGSCCELCGKAVPKANLSLHRLRCGTEANEPAEMSCRPKSEQVVTSSANQNKDANSKKERKKKKEKKSINGTALLNKIDGDDFESLLAAADRLNSVCNFKKCKSLVKTLGTTCEHCNLRFCLSHGMAEVHGCGAEAKHKARASLSKEMGARSGSGPANRKLNASARANLERKLNQKMSAFSEQRRPKEKEK